MMTRLRFPCKKNPTLSTMIRYEDEDNNNSESSKGPSNADAFSALETAIEWFSNNNQSAVLLNHCCSSESEILQQKNKVQWYSEK
ncbi:hypothetical protein TNCV_149471 [Trichonephila clavipes]|nr:hypothetical protein TNCV_149471 [Trichonephila clavipes]